MLAVRWLTMGCSGVGGTGELMRGSWAASGTKEAVPGRRWGAGGARPLPCRGLEPTACGGDPALCCHCGVWLSSPTPGQFGVSPHHAAFTPHPRMLWGQFQGAPGTAIPPPSALGTTIPGHLGDPRMEVCRIPHPNTLCHSAGSGFGEVEGRMGGAWGGWV